MSTNLSLPPITVLATAAADLVLEADQAGNTARMNGLNKAALHLHSGLQITLTVGGILVPSGTRGGVVHRVSALGCSCEAARAGRCCWHQLLIEIIEQAQMRTIPLADKISAARTAAWAKADKEINELWA